VLFMALVPQGRELRAAQKGTNGKSGARQLVALVISYGLFGFGYVITATFISALVRAEPPLKPLEPVIWLIVGIGAIPSVALWTWVGRRVGNGRAYALACLVEAGAVALSVMSLSPAAVALSALLLGGTFVGITATGLIDVRELSQGDPRRNLALMTAVFGIGQMIGPSFGGFLHDHSGSFLLPSLAAAVFLLAAAALVGATAGPPRR
jgi:predicted MFS family arabinose efflux permease